MVDGVFVKEAKIQFWHKSWIPDWTGVAFSIDCCPCPCWMRYDTFYPDPDTTYPDYWIEVVGDWGISGFALVENYSTGTSGTANAVAILDQAQPAEHAGEQVCSVDVENPQTGDFYYLYMCITDNDSIAGCVTIEFECTGSPGSWTVRAGSETKTFAVLPDGLGRVKLGACVDNSVGMIKAWVEYGPNEPLWDDNATVTSGRYAGVGHNNTGHLNIFDNFLVAELHLSGDTMDARKDLCDDCFCYCLTQAIPRELTLTVVDAIGRSSCHGGYSCTLTWEWNSGVPRWRGSYTVVNGSLSQTFEWCLECTGTNADDESNPGKNFTLTLCSFNGCASTWTSGWSTVWSVTGATSCDPLLLRFGPFPASIYDLTCFLCELPGSGDATGEWYIEITL